MPTRPSKLVSSSAVLVALAIALLAMTALHFLQPELDPVEEPVSFYVHGSYGALLTLSLIFFGLASIGSAAGLTDLVSSRARWSLIIFGTGMVLMAIIPSDTWFPWEADPSLSGLIHSAIATISPVFLLDPMAAYAKLRPRDSAAAGKWLFIAYAVGIAGSAVSLVYGFLVDRAPPAIGIAERVLAFVAVGWVGLVAWQVRNTRE